MNIHTDRKIYSVPDGLNELLYDISKEVLRCKPKNMFQFISDFLISKLRVREAMKVAVPIVDTIESFGKASVDTLIKYNLNAEEGDRLATIIQAAFRGYRERKRLSELAYEVDKVFDKNDDLLSEVDFTDPLFDVLRTRGVSKIRMVEAAVKIQSFYRGHRVRRQQKEKGPECLIHGVPSHESWRHDWLNEPLEETKPDEHLPWRSSFSKFYNNVSRLSEGNRLRIDTIYGGHYEDYNYVCDHTSCEEFLTPTITEVRELLPPGDTQSFVSDVNEHIKADMKKKVIDRIEFLSTKDEKVLYKALTKSQVSSSIAEFDAEDLYEETPSELNTKSLINLPVRQSSQTRVDQIRDEVPSKHVITEVEEDGNLFPSESKLVSEIDLKSEKSSSSKTSMYKNDGQDSKVTSTNDVRSAKSADSKPIVSIKSTSKASLNNDAPELIVRSLSGTSTENKPHTADNESTGSRGSNKRKISIRSGGSADEKKSISKKSNTSQN